MKTEPGEKFSKLYSLWEALEAVFSDAYPISAKGLEQTVLLPAKGFPPLLFLFSRFPFPLRPCHSHKAQTRTHKNFSLHFEGHQSP